MPQLLRRNDLSDDVAYGPSTFIFFTLLLLASGCVATLVILRRKRQQRALRATALPLHQRHGHQRTLTIATTPSGVRGESIFVYDEKMNLIANSHGPPSSTIPEIHVTFPEDEDASGTSRAGRVVVLRISDTGSVGMEPLHQEPLPPYQRDDAERFQSLDLDRMGGLREKNHSTNQRYS